MKQGIFLRFLTGTLLSSLTLSCSGNKSKGIESSDDADVSASKSDSILNAALEDSGVINFFDTPGIERGLVIRSIKWGEPISSENPGTDCELKRRQVGPPTEVFACVARAKGHEAVVLSLHEVIEGEKRALRRITMDGKGKDTRDRWIKTVEGFGYTKVKVAKGKDRAAWISPDRETLLTVVWAAAANAVTIILDPAKK